VLRSKSKSSTDYHTEMKSEIYGDGFITIYLYLILDPNQLLLRRTQVNVPLFWTRLQLPRRGTQIVAWFCRNIIPHSPKRAEILELAKGNKSRCKMLKLDNIAQEYSHPAALPPGKEPLAPTG
jgi:hypothetical protein